MESFHQPIDIGNGRVSIGVSIGICFYPDNGKNVAELINSADLAMCQAKRIGGGFVCYKVDNRQL